MSIVAALSGNFRCQGDDEWVSISVFNDEEWTRDERFRDVLNRRKHQDELEPLVESWMMRHDYYEVMHLLQKEGVAAGPVLNDAAVYQDPHLLERGFFVEESQEDVGTHMYPGFMTRMSKTPSSVRRGPVRLGEDNEYLYKQVLGVSDAEYKELVKGGHIGMDYAAHIQ